MKLGLKWKITLLIVSLLLIVVIAVRFIVVEKMRLALTKEVIESGKSIAKNMARPTKDALLGGELGPDYLTLGILASQATEQTNIVYAYVIDSENIVRAYADKSATTKAEEVRNKPYKTPQELIEYSNEGGVRILKDNINGIYEVEVPLKVAEKDIGKVKIGLSQEGIKNAVRQTVNIAVRVTLGILAIGIIGAFLLGNYLVGPIKNLLEGVTEIGTGNFDYKVAVQSRDELGDLTNAFNKMAKGLKERETIKDAFSRYVSHDVLNQVLKNKIQLGGERKLATILFSDIRDFTTMAESLKPELVVEILNEYFTVMTDVIFKNEGTVDKFIGDGILAVFGLPIAHEDDPKRTVQAAIEMQSELNKLHEKWKNEGKPQFKIGIGINTTEVIVGNIGSTKRMEYTVIGDGVNTTARIESLNKNYGTTILISDNTYDILKDYFVFNDLGEAQVKGKKDTVHIYEVKGYKQENKT